jgi:hypothetical protein
MPIVLFGLEQIKAPADLVIVFWCCFFLQICAPSGARGPPCLPPAFFPPSRKCARLRQPDRTAERGFDPRTFGL